MSSFKEQQQQQQQQQKHQLDDAYSVALLRSLRAAGVQFLRYSAMDLCGQARVKMVPLDYLQKHKLSLHHEGVSYAKACLAGLPSHADSIVAESGLTASSGDVRLAPAMETLRVLPYAPQSAMVLCNLVEDIETADAAVATTTGQPSDYCSRGLLQSILDMCRRDYNIAFTVGAELEFCLHNQEGMPVDKSRYAGSTTINQQQDFIADAYQQLVAQDIEIELLHAESAPGQLEFVLRHQDDAVRLADDVFLAKETIQAVARKHGLKAVFLPKMDEQQAGNGLHLHISIRMVDLFSNNVLTETDRTCFIEGIIRRLGSLLALTIPSVNSFRRIGPGCWTGFDASWAFHDKEAAIRVVSQDFSHFEYKLCDATANLYLALAGIIAAGLDGITEQAALRPSRSDNNAELPSSLITSLVMLESDAAINDAFPRPLMKAYIALRRAEAKREESSTFRDHVLTALNEA